MITTNYSCRSRGETGSLVVGLPRRYVSCFGAVRVVHYGQCLPAVSALLNVSGG